MLLCALGIVWERCQVTQWWNTTADVMILWSNPDGLIMRILFVIAGMAFLRNFVSFILGRCIAVMDGLLLCYWECMACLSQHSLIRGYDNEFPHDLNVFLDIKGFMIWSFFVMALIFNLCFFFQTNRLIYSWQLWSIKTLVQASCSKCHIHSVAYNYYHSCWVQ